nr:hypothetical protein BaRGS_014397 [Batillaria attramentaria]KAG5690770.1 hypothetical protein BaRGS_013060 [Batillaria attramentaria]
MAISIIILAIRIINLAISIITLTSQHKQRHLVAAGPDLADDPVNVFRPDVISVHLHNDVTVLETGGSGW